LKGVKPVSILQLLMKLYVANVKKDILIITLPIDHIALHALRHVEMVHKVVGKMICHFLALDVFLDILLIHQDLQIAELVDHTIVFKNQKYQVTVRT